jgi:hypothetical protein
MSDPLVLALVAHTAPQKALAAGFEEEGVPLMVEVTDGPVEALARQAARRTVLGIGIGADAERLVLTLAAAPGRPYLAADAADARCFGHAAARLAARRPLRGFA